MGSHTHPGSPQNYRPAIRQQYTKRHATTSGDRLGPYEMKFLITTPLEQSSAQTQTPITVVLNWQADLKK